MKRIVLKNGMRVIYEKRDSDIVAVGVVVEVGSNYETGFHKGISHVMEHMVMSRARSGEYSIISEAEAKYGMNLVHPLKKH